MSNYSLKDSLKRIIPLVALSIVITLFLYRYVGVILLQLLVDEHEMRMTGNYSSGFLLLFPFYPLVCAFTYIGKLTDESIGLHAEKIGIAEDMKNYICTEGKILLFIYAVFAVIFEISYLISGNGQNILSVIFTFCFPISFVIPIPILRTIIAYIAEMVMLFALIALSRFIYRKRNS